MKKAVTMILIIFIMSFISLFSVSFATAINITDTNTTSKIIETKNSMANAVDQYITNYGSESYGWTAYTLHVISIYSIPVCFLGIIVGALFQYVIGVRRLDMRHRGSRMMMAFITLLVVAQVLPLIFALVVRGWVH